MKFWKKNQKNPDASGALCSPARAFKVLTPVLAALVAGWVMLALPLENWAEAREPTRQPSAGESAPKTDSPGNKEVTLNPEATATLKLMRDFWKRAAIIPRNVPTFPEFTLPPRKSELEMYPCSDCHEDTSINLARERKLVDEHQNILLDHGGKRFWCVTCHNINNMDFLTSPKGKPIDFNSPHILCGECHAPRQADWFFGGHGKRIWSWRGEKIALACTECHNPHSPSIKPRPPEPHPEIPPPPLPFTKLVLMELSELAEWLGAASPNKP